MHSQLRLVDVAVGVVGDRRPTGHPLGAKGGGDEWVRMDVVSACVSAFVSELVRERVSECVSACVSE